MRSVVLVMVIASAVFSGCATVTNASGVLPQNVDSSQRGPVAGLGIEGNDIGAMADQMARDMLSSTDLVRTPPPRVIIDSGMFKNDSMQPIDKDMITGKLRIELQRASQGRFKFVGRSYAGEVAKERELKRQGVTDIGTTGLTKTQHGADFRLGGKIASLVDRNSRTGMIKSYFQIQFEMVDMETSEIVWTGIYEFTRAGADDVVYH